MNASPLWLQDASVRELLNMLVNRLDGAQQRKSTKTQSIALGERTWPALYKASMESHKEDLWEYVIAMASWKWLAIKPERALEPRSGYAFSPRLTVLNEDEVRAAIGRPERLKSAPERWREAVLAGLHAPLEVKQIVSEYCIDIPNHPMDEVVQRLNVLPTLADKPLLLREVSSQLFWGMSKLLDRRQGLVAALLGMQDCPFPDSPIQLQVYLPPTGYRGVLFIENLTSFARAIASRNALFNELALVFAAGFKGSAPRLRSPQGCTIFYAAHGGLTPDLTHDFEKWLFKDTPQIPIYFWGDLDYAGMRILLTLRTTFPQLLAWEPGYAPLLQALYKEQSHLPRAAKKLGQKTLLITGCPYADTMLLPALHETGRFIDQEWLSI